MSSSSSSVSAVMTERKYKGVRWRRWGKWVAEIRRPNNRKRIWLGSYDTPEKAARAFDGAFVCLHGRVGAEAKINFPDLPPAVARTDDRQEVYAAAVAHANRPSARVPAMALPREEAQLVEKAAEEPNNMARGNVVAHANEPSGHAPDTALPREEALVVEEPDDVAGRNVVVPPVQVTGAASFEWLQHPLYSPSPTRHDLPMWPSADESNEYDQSSTSDLNDLWNFHSSPTHPS